MYLLGTVLRSGVTISSPRNKMIKDLDFEADRENGSKAFFIDIWTITLAAMKEQRMPRLHNEGKRKRQNEWERVEGGKNGCSVSRHGLGSARGIKSRMREKRWKKNRWWTSEIQWEHRCNWLASGFMCSSCLWIVLNASHLQDFYAHCILLSPLPPFTDLASSILYLEYDRLLV